MNIYKESKYFKADLLYIGRCKIHKHIYPSNTHKDFSEEKLFSSKTTKEKEWEWAGAHLVVHSAPQGSLPWSSWTTLSYFSHFHY